MGPTIPNLVQTVPGKKIYTVIMIGNIKFLSVPRILDRKHTCSDVLGFTSNSHYI